MGQFGSAIDTASYDMNANVLMLDGRYNLFEKGELYFNLSASQTDAGFDTLMMRAASDVPLSLVFPDGLPGPGDDLTAPLHYHDYDFTSVHEYSDMDYTEYRATVGLNYKVLPYLGLYGAVSYLDVSDDDPYLQDATGSVTLLSGGLTWHF